MLPGIFPDDLDSAMGGGICPRVIRGRGGEICPPRYNNAEVPAAVGHAKMVEKRRKTVTPQNSHLSLKGPKGFHSIFDGILARHPLSINLLQKRSSLQQPFACN